VLAKLGAEVIAIDKAPLDPRVSAMAGVSWRGESAPIWLAVSDAMADVLSDDT
jgi:hypothetical protein